MEHPDLAEHARTLLDRNRYLTLGTVGADGRPWTTPVYFAAAGIRDYYWISEIDAEHSRNLAERPAVSLVVFDSTVEPYHGRAVYASGSARTVPDGDIDAGLSVYPGSGERGVPTMTRDDVSGSSPYRLYRVTASDVWVLCPRAPGEPCALHGLAKDHRARVAT